MDMIFTERTIRSEKLNSLCDLFQTGLQLETVPVGIELTIVTKIATYYVFHVSYASTLVITRVN